MDERKKLWAEVYLKSNYSTDVADKALLEFDKRFPHVSDVIDWDEIDKKYGRDIKLFDYFKDTVNAQLKKIKYVRNFI